MLKWQMHMCQVGAERDRVGELQRQVAAMQDRIAEQRRQMGGVNSARECDIQVGLALAFVTPHVPG